MPKKLIPPESQRPQAEDKRTLELELCARVAMIPAVGDFGKAQNDQIDQKIAHFLSKIRRQYQHAAGWATILVRRTGRAVCWV
jgi:hypothetical protein